MVALIEFLGANARGVVVLLLLLGGSMVLVQWCVWLAGIGRFRGRAVDGSGRATATYYLGTFVAQIITEFRHLLALVIVLLFAATMFVVIWAGWNDFDSVSKGVQLVSASLGGLIGSIIGYYFGESKARAEGAAPARSSAAAPTSGEGPTPSATPVQSVTPPPGANP